MKILYINNYRENSGWSEAGRQMILAMDHVGIDVVPRPIFITNNKCDIPQRIKELEQKSSNGCTHVIQHVLPNMVEYNGRYQKNICLFASETTNFLDSNWTKYLNLMDECWVINTESKQASLDSGVKVPIKIVSHPCNPAKYNREFNKLNIPVPNDTVLIYFIGEFSRRKNLVALIKSFHLTFDRTENVQLLLKVNKNGISGPDLSKVVGEFCNDIKKGLKLYNNVGDYKPELILTDFLSDDQLLDLHYSCDIFVNPSFGEAWNLPLFDAAAIGNFVISSDNGGPSDYIPNYEDGDLCSTWNDPCFAANDNIANLYTARENWGAIEITSLSRAMRNYYNKCVDDAGNKIRKKNMLTGCKLAEQYSYNKVGNLIKQLLKD